MLDTQTIDFSNISNNVMGMDYIIKPNSKLIKALEDISRAITKSKHSATFKAGGVEYVVPKDIEKLLLVLSERMSMNEQVKIAFVGEELTTQQAADYLDVSRPTLIKLVEENNLAIKRVGKHRRITREQLAFLDGSLKQQKDQAIRGMIKGEILSRAEMRSLVTGEKP